VTGYRFALILENGEPADPMVFPTIFPFWKPGDTFLAGTQLRCFRIVAIAPIHPEEAGGPWDCIWVVEPVE
jgi:hypothetical protein